MADLNQGSMFKKYIKQHKKKTNGKRLRLNIIWLKIKYSK